jgi:hypothetical protein
MQTNELLLPDGSWSPPVNPTQDSPAINLRRALTEAEFDPRSRMLRTEPRATAELATAFALLVVDALRIRHVHALNTSRAPAVRHPLGF